MSQECMLTKEKTRRQLQDPGEVEMSGIEMSSPSCSVLRSDSLLTWASGVQFPHLHTLLRQHVQRWHAAPVRRLLWEKSITFSVSLHTNKLCAFSVVTFITSYDDCLVVPVVTLQIQALRTELCSCSHVHWRHIMKCLCLKTESREN